MNKLWYVAIAIATAIGGITVVRVFIKPQVVYVPVPVPTQSTVPVRPPIHQGHFEDQLRPEMPPVNGGRYSK